MPKRTILVIRHAEKPADPPAPQVSRMSPGDDGAQNLTPRGWQRAGALIRYFAPRGRREGRPAALYAALSDAAWPSLRTQQTIAPLAAFLDIAPVLPALPDGTAAAARAILSGRDPALVCWEHKNIARLVAAVTGDEALAPHWSSDRFDMVLALTRSAGKWSLVQVPQMLLAGDPERPLRDRRPGEHR